MFWITVLVSMVLTMYSGLDTSKSPLITVFGYNNICVNFDFPPSTYVLPCLYAVTVVFLFATIVICIEQARVVVKSQREYVLIVGGYSFTLFTFLFFSTIFAVSPRLQDMDPDFVTLGLHTFPFTVLQFGTAMLPVVWLSHSMLMDQVERFNLPYVYTWKSVLAYAIACFGIAIFKAVTSWNDIFKERFFDGDWAKAGTPPLQIAWIVDRMYLLCAAIAPPALAWYRMRYHWDVLPKVDFSKVLNPSLLDQYTAVIDVSVDDPPAVAMDIEATAKLSAGVCAHIPDPKCCSCCSWWPITPRRTMVILTGLVVTFLAGRSSGMSYTFDGVSSYPFDDTALFNVMEPLSAEMKASRKRRAWDCPCPFLRTAYVQGMLEPDEFGYVSTGETYRVMRWAGVGLLAFPPGNYFKKFGQSGLPLLHLALNRPVDTGAMHANISDAREKLDIFKSFSNSGKFYAEDFAKAIDHNVKKHEADTHAMFNMRGELSTMLAVFGREGNNYMTTDDIEALWWRSEWPQDWADTIRKPCPYGQFTSHDLTMGLRLLRMTRSSSGSNIFAILWGFMTGGLEVGFGTSDLTNSPLTRAIRPFNDWPRSRLESGSVPSEEEIKKKTRRTGYGYSIAWDSRTGGVQGVIDGKMWEPTVFDKNCTTWQLPYYGMANNYQVLDYLQGHSAKTAGCIPEAIR